MTNAAEQRFSDLEWKAKRYDYLLTNDSEAVWQAERELQVMRERVAELEAALEAYGSHDTDCAALTSGHWSREHLPPACNCGLSALLEKNSSRPTPSGICSLHRDGEDPTCPICYDQPQKNSTQAGATFVRMCTCKEKSDLHTGQHEAFCAIPSKPESGSSPT